MLKNLSLFLIAIPLLFKASQLKEKPLSPRTLTKIEEAKQELKENLTKIELAYIETTASHHLLLNNPKAWLYMKGAQALQACKLQESSDRADIISYEHRTRERILEEAFRKKN